MPLFHVDEHQMNFLQIIIGNLENVLSLDAKANYLHLKGMFVEENGRSLIEIQIEGTISDLEQEKGITIKYSKDDLENVAHSMHHFDNTGLISIPRAVPTNNSYLVRDNSPLT